MSLAVPAAQVVPGITPESNKLRNLSLGIDSLSSSNILRQLVVLIARIRSLIEVSPNYILILVIFTVAGQLNITHIASF